MIRIIAATLTLGALAVTASSAVAQDLTAAQRTACQADYNAFCKGTLPGGGRILACLTKNNDKISAACKKVVAEAKK